MRRLEAPPESLEQAIEEASDRAREAIERGQRVGAPDAEKRRGLVEKVASEVRDRLVAAPRARLLRTVAVAGAAVQLGQLAVAGAWIGALPEEGGLASAQLAGKSAVLFSLCVLIVSDPRRFGRMA